MIVDSGEETDLNVEKNETCDTIQVKASVCLTMTKTGADVGVRGLTENQIDT
jgi:hypothetical protein